MVAAGGSTSCGGAYTPSAGSQTVPVVVSGTTAAGTVRTSGTAYLTGTTPVAAGGPDPGTPDSGKDSSCACDLTTGTPAFDGVPAGSSKGAQVPAGQAGTLSVPVSNTGSQQVSGLTAQTSQGSLTCADTTLAPGGSTTCSGPATPSAGDEVVPITVSGTTPDGPRSITGYGYLHGTSGSTTPGGSNPGGSNPGSTPGGSNPGSTPGGSNPGSTPGGSNPGSTPGGSNPGGSTPTGSITVNGATYPVSNGSVTVGGMSYPVNPDGTVSIGGVSYPVTANAPGSTTPGGSNPGSTPGGSNPGSTPGGSNPGGSTPTGSITVNG
ncbi:hypothetical protein, partial [Nocardioides maradonensis]